MHHLITKYFKRKITKFEKDELFSLMETDNELKKDFISLQNVYGLYSLMPSENDDVIALQKLKQFKQRRSRKNLSLALRKTTHYAAIICVTVFVTWLILKNTSLMGEAKPLVAYEELTTPAGQRVMVKLHDGSTVWLNARSTLRYPTFFAGGERRVELDGEAFFEIAPNTEQPFVVVTEKLNIKALGTQFNVSAYKEQHDFNTSLIEGSVKIYTRENESNALFITPHEYAKLEGNRLIKRSFDNMNFLLWKEGIYAFDNVAFADIMLKMEWFYDIKVDVHNRNLGSYKFSGKIRHRDGIENVLRTLQKVYHFSFVKDDEHNLITIQ